MAGSDPGFSADDFRAGIRQAMQMGAPSNPNEQVQFIFDEQRTFSGAGAADAAGRPYSWNQRATTDTPARSVTVPVAVQYGEGATEANPMGGFDTSRVTLTLLDEDYQQVKGASEFAINGRHYVIQPLAPPIGMFDATLYQVFGVARG